MPAYICFTTEKRSKDRCILWSCVSIAKPRTNGDGYKGVHQPNALQLLAVNRIRAVVNYYRVITGREPMQLMNALSWLHWWMI